MFLSGDAIAVVEVASWTFTCDPRENIIIAFSFCCLQQLFIDSLYLLHFPHHKRSLNSRRPNSTKVSNRQYLKEKALLRSTVREIARLTWGWSKSSLIFRFTNPFTLKLIIRRRKRLLKTFPKDNRPKSQWGNHIHQIQVCEWKEKQMTTLWGALETLSKTCAIDGSLLFARCWTEVSLFTLSPAVRQGTKKRCL